MYKNGILRDSDWWGKVRSTIYWTFGVNCDMLAVMWVWSIREVDSVAHKEMEWKNSVSLVARHVTFTTNSDRASCFVIWPWCYWYRVVVLCVWTLCCNINVIFSGNLLTILTSVYTHKRLAFSIFLCNINIGNESRSRRPLSHLLAIGGIRCLQDCLLATLALFLPRDTYA